MENDPTPDYLFLAPDIREDEDGAVRWPYIRRDDSQDLDWWSEEPLSPGKPVDFSADPAYPHDEDIFRAMRVAVVGGFPLLRPGLEGVLRPFAPPSAQLIPSYVKTGRSRYDWDEDWLLLHLWEMRDVVDRARSSPTMVEGEAFGTWDSIRLDPDAMGRLGPEERSIVRLASDEEDFLIFHRSMVERLLDFGLAGALFVPLQFYAPAMSFIREHRREIDQINGPV
ncbi:MAG: hypothetical protein AAFY65_17865 [Pseudomonadota bacterium]